MYMNSSKLQEVVHDREAWHAQSMWSQKTQTQLSNWTTKTTKKLQKFWELSSRRWEQIDSGTND